MNDREKIKKILESEEIPVQLRPENIDLIIKSRRRQKAKYSGKSFRNQYICIFAGLALCLGVSTSGIILTEKKDSNIILSDGVGNANISVETETVSSEEYMLKSAESYDEIYEIFSAASKNYNNVYNCMKYSDETETDEVSVNQENIFSGNSISSEINKAVTDGKSIFSTDENNSYINIARVSSGEFLYNYSVNINEDLNSEICGMYITDNKLIVISDENTVTTVLAYSIGYKDDNPKLAYLGKYSQSGSFSDIRIKDDYIYIITSETKNLYGNINSEDYDEYLPSYYVNGEKRYIQYENIYIPSDFRELNSEELNTGFTTVGALKINQDYGNINTDRNGDIFIETDIKSFVKSAEFVYCSENNLYVTVSNYSNAYTQNTDILKFSLSDGNIIQQGVGNVKGIPLSQISMNEYNDYFAIEVTYMQDAQVVDTKYALYIFDSDMNIVGLLDDFTNDQNIKDFKFFEDTAYAMTYSEQSEPVLAIDLSNPENPSLNDNLKLIYGTYMQKWNDNLFLEIGISTDENGIKNGFKLNMSDISDMYNIYEVSTAEFICDYDSEQFLGSPAFEDSQAMLVSPEKNLIGIPYYSQKYDEDFMTFGYSFYSFSDDCFNYIGNVSELKNECYRMDRALYIDNYIYIICGNKFISFSMSDGISENNTIIF